MNPSRIAIRMLLAAAVATTAPFFSVPTTDSAPDAPNSELAPVWVGLDQAYTREVHRQTDHFAAWEPSSNFNLGDYGYMEGGVFKKLGNIKRFGIKFKVTKSPGSPTHYTSSKNVGVNIDVGAKGPDGKNHVDVKVSFKGRRNIMLVVADVTKEQVKGIDKLGKAMIKLLKQKGKDWKLKYVVITSLSRSKSGCVLISKESDSKVTLSGKASLKAGQATLADLELGDFSIGVSKGRIYEQPWSNECTPLFQLHTVNNPILKQPRFKEFK